MKRCGICGQEGGIVIQLHNEIRRMCRTHYKQWLAKDGEYDVIFQKASKYKLDDTK